jgi:hypothetical protein
MSVSWTLAYQCRAYHTTHPYYLYKLLLCYSTYMPISPCAPVIGTSHPCKQMSVSWILAYQCRAYRTSHPYYLFKLLQYFAILLICQYPRVPLWLAPRSFYIFGCGINMILFYFILLFYVVSAHFLVLGSFKNHQDYNDWNLICVVSQFVTGDPVLELNNCFQIIIKNAGWTLRCFSKKCRTYMALKSGWWSCQGILFGLELLLRWFWKLWVNTPDTTTIAGGVNILPVFLSSERLKPGRAFQDLFHYRQVPARPNLFSVPP